ncbi:hypothetical protein [Lyngbya aestuarii]|uniref:hypothetical protein n=1 Tax=Lyngbya aestuarii TaxID=118322 RepID=UPI00403D57BA
MLGLYYISIASSGVDDFCPECRSVSIGQSHLVLGQVLLRKTCELGNTNHDPFGFTIRVSIVEPG